MAIHRFTDRWLNSCPVPPQGRLEYADALCPGLYLRVTARRVKSFSVLLRVNRRQQRRTIGQYPGVSLAGARAEALNMLRGAAAGVDPRQPLDEAASLLTYSELVAEYAERHLVLNTRSYRNIQSGLLHLALRHLRTRPVAGIAKREFVAAVDSIAAAGTPQAAVNVLRWLKMMFNWAVDRDMLPANPCERIRPAAKTVERDRVLSDAEIAAVWKASSKLPTPYGEMYRMFMLTGQRRSEVATMRWNDIASDVWTIPREKVKKDRSHAVPLTSIALDTLAELAKRPRAVADGFVFTTTGGKSATGNFAKIKRDLDQLSGVTGWTIHDIRRTVRSKLAELGVSRDVARKVMNHEDGKVDRIYNRHEYLAEKREALEQWERMMKTLMISSSSMPLKASTEIGSIK